MVQSTGRGVPLGRPADPRPQAPEPRGGPPRPLASGPLLDPHRRGDRPRDGQRRPALQGPRGLAQRPHGLAEARRAEFPQAAVAPPPGRGPGRGRGVWGCSRYPGAASSHPTLSSPSAPPPARSDSSPSASFDRHRERGSGDARRCARAPGSRRRVRRSRRQPSADRPGPVGGLGPSTLGGEGRASHRAPSRDDRRAIGALPLGRPSPVEQPHTARIPAYPALAHVRAPCVTSSSLRRAPGRRSPPVCHSLDRLARKAPAGASGSRP